MVKILLIIIFYSYTVLAQSSEKEWTMLIYMNGHNNMSAVAARNIRDLEIIGSTPDINVVVEVGDDSNINRRMYIQKSINVLKVTSPSLMDLPNHDMGNYRNLQSFLEWGVKNFPAKHYFVVLWNHGEGWQTTDFKNTRPTDVSFDDKFKTYISTEQVGVVMSNLKKVIGRNIDIYGSDACLMQMLEVAGEMKDSINYFVGSQDNEPIEGWPYYPFMQKWSAAPKMAAAEVSVLLSKEFAEAYSGGIYGKISRTTFSAWDMSKIDGVYDAVKNLAKTLMSLNPQDIKKARLAALSTTHFARDDYADLGDFMPQLRYQKIRSIDEKLLDDVNIKVKDLVLSSDNDPDYYPNATGVSIWLPTMKNNFQARYEQLQFSEATGWNYFTKLSAQ